MRRWFLASNSAVNSAVTLPMTITMTITNEMSETGALLPIQHDTNENKSMQRGYLKLQGIHGIKKCGCNRLHARQGTGFSEILGWIAYPSLEAIIYRNAFSPFVYTNYIIVFFLGDPGLEE